MKNTKKIILGMVMTIMFVISMFSALAIDVEASASVDNNKVAVNYKMNNTVQNREQAELRLFADENGAEIRILQLKRSILRNIAQGEDIIEKTNPENVDELNRILDELQIIADSLNETDVSDKDKALEVFLDTKEQVKELVNEFKSNLNIDEEQRNQLRKELQQKKFESVEKLDEKIVEKRNKYNAKKVEELLNKLNIKNTELVEKIKRGNINKNQVREMISKEFEQIKGEEKSKLLAKYREEKSKIEIKLKERKNKLVKEQHKRLEEKREQIRQRLMNEGKNIRDKVKNKLKNIMAKDSDRIEFKHSVNVNEDDEHMGVNAEGNVHIGLNSEEDSESSSSTTEKKSTPFNKR